MRLFLRCLVAIAVPLAGVAGQGTPRFAGLTASRLLVVPAQAVSGVADAGGWLVRFDSVFTDALRAGGIGSGWAYALDAVRYQRQNPSYLTDVRALGVRPIAGDAVRDGTPLPEPFASRVRAYVALADASLAIVPVAAAVDSASTPNVVRLRLVIVDGRSSRVVAVANVSAPFTGSQADAADALALQTARLFLALNP